MLSEKVLFPRGHQTKEKNEKNEEKRVQMGFLSLFSPVIEFSSVIQSCLTLCNPMDCSTPGFLVLHYLPEFAQTHVHRDNDAIQPPHPLSFPSPLALSLSQDQGFSQRGGSSHQVATVLELQLQHHSFQRIFRTDFL